MGALELSRGRVSISEGSHARLSVNSCSKCRQRQDRLSHRYDIQTRQGVYSKVLLNFLGILRGVDSRNSTIMKNLQAKLYGKNFLNCENYIEIEFKHDFKVLGVKSKFAIWLCTKHALSIE